MGLLFKLHDSSHYEVPVLVTYHFAELSSFRLLCFSLTELSWRLSVSEGWPGCQKYSLSPKRKLHGISPQHVLAPCHQFKQVLRWLRDIFLPSENLGRTCKRESCEESIRVVLAPTVTADSNLLLLLHSSILDLNSTLPVPVGTQKMNSSVLTCCFSVSYKNTNIHLFQPILRRLLV